MNRFLPYVERGLLLTGALLLGGVALVVAFRFTSSQNALRQFDRAQTALVETGNQPRQAAPSLDDVSFALWSPKRIRAYRDSLSVLTAKPMAVVSLHRLGIRAPVFPGTSELVLNRGIGWIDGTSRPGEPGNGNIGIAGHRDGFFRALKDVAVGDVLELATPGVVSSYAVDSIEIVDPSDVHVLRPRGVPSLTVVTCFPFYFAGDAPQRFIVHGTLKRQDKASENQKHGSAQARTVGS